MMELMYIKKGISMKIEDFIKENKKTIDYVIQDKFEDGTGVSIDIDDDEREYWVFNNIELAILAKKKGVNI